MNSESNPRSLWQAQWPKNNLKQENPFVSDAFLTAMETSGACTESSGWKPHHFSPNEHSMLPMYAKKHSRGEYVFDYAWAQAYSQHGLNYYPKLLVAAPFTPSQGPRMLGVNNLDDAKNIIEALKAHTQTNRYSGFHILFPQQSEQALLNDLDLARRSDVQFHWRNEKYRDFADFLERFPSRKRKNLNKERRSIGDQGIEMITLEGDQIDEKSWSMFYQFYHATYLKRGQHGYLNEAFFSSILATMRDQLVLIMAKRRNQYVAGALCFKDSHTLYGRYWGCFEEFNNLHFEACYYQGIEYCIKHGLSRFDPGTQGEHKIARGFEPTKTYSYHWLAHSEFQSAVSRFCHEEQRHTQAYFDDVLNAVPFKSDVSTHKETE